MITEFTVYAASGKVLRTGSCIEAQADQQADTSKGESVVYTKADIKNDTVIADSGGGPPVVTLKATNNIAINKTTFFASGTDEVIISGIGSGALVDIRMPPSIDVPDILDVPVDDGQAIITTLYPGAYLVNIDDGQTQPYEVTLNAV
jgi:hypothetical protein